MNKSTRMLLMNSSRDKEPRRRRVGVEYEDWAPTGHYGPYMPTTIPYMPMEPESAFYDDRGRRHYNNGRYAPMDVYGEPESVRRYRRDSDGQFAPRSDYSPMDTGRRSGDSPRMIGFGRSWEDRNMRSDATMPQMIEMDRLRGARSQTGAAYSDYLPHFDRQMAMEWTQGMVNADGTRGPHWTMEQTTEAMKKHGLDYDPLEWYAVLNSIYSDYCEALKTNNASTLETYVCLAKAWLDDKDTVADKAAAYFTYIVKH